MNLSEAFDVDSSDPLKTLSALFSALPLPDLPVLQEFYHIFAEVTVEFVSDTLCGFSEDANKH